MVIRYLPFFPCLQSEIDGLYQNISSQTFIEQNQERNTKGTVHEIPEIFLLSELCLHLLLLPTTREFSRKIELEFKFAGMPAVKLCDSSSCRRRMFSFVREVAKEAPSATSQVHRRYMRTRLK